MANPVNAGSVNAGSVNAGSVNAGSVKSDPMHSAPHRYAPPFRPAGEPSLTGPAHGLLPVMDRPQHRPGLALVIAWSYEPGRTGEILLVPLETAGQRMTFGRGEEGPPELPLRLSPSRQRPWMGPFEQRLRPLMAGTLSRTQAEVYAEDGPEGASLVVTHLRGNRLLHNGRVVSRARLRPGDVLEVENTLLLYCTSRSLVLPDWPSARLWPSFAFGAADAFGIIGESPAVWKLRGDLMLRAQQPDLHVLLHGPTGVGKELAARALHLLTPGRGQRALEGTNSSTFSSSLVNLELFGDDAEVIQKGLKTSEGLFGRANGSSIFLDEIATLPLDIQPRLLRVLDEGGSYQRVGSGRTLTADVRLIAATNQPLEMLRADLRYRLDEPIFLPSLEQRREDIPLIVEQTLLKWSGQVDHPLREQASRLILRESGEVRAQLHPSLTTWLLRQAWPGNVRELLKLLARLVNAHRGEGMLLPPEGIALERPLELPAPGGWRVEAESMALPPTEPPDALWTPEELSALEELRSCGFVLERCQREIFGKKGASAASYLLRRLIWKAILHHRKQPDAALEALFGGPLPVLSSESAARLRSHVARAVRAAHDLEGDLSSGSSRNYTVQGLELARELREAVHEGSLVLPENWSH